MQLTNILHVVNAHCEGVACDVLVGGLPPVRGETVLEKKHYFNSHMDHFRTLLVWEPRAAETQHMNVIVESRLPGVDFGFLTLEKAEIVDMSGGNIISTATVLLETGMVEKQEPVTEFKLETPAGVIEISAQVQNGRVGEVTFVNCASFVLHRDAHIEVPGMGELRVDVVWGGMWYLVVEARDLGLDLVPAEHHEIVRLGELVKQAARQQLEVVHPNTPGLADFVQNTLIAGPLHREGRTVRSRNTVVVSPGYIDRCPCGTGTSGRLSLLRERGEFAAGDTLIHESLIGTEFRARVVDTVQVGTLPAVVPSVSGRAWITGTQTVGVDPTDPYPYGFSLDALAEGRQERS